MFLQPSAGVGLSFPLLQGRGSFSISLTMALFNQFALTWSQERALPCDAGSCVRSSIHSCSLARVGF